jgi:hypothetical protein
MREETVDCRLAQPGSNAVSPRIARNVDRKSPPLWMQPVPECSRRANDSFVIASDENRADYSSWRPIGMVQQSLLTKEAFQARNFDFVENTHSTSL